jgi:MFS family permease
MAKDQAGAGTEETYSLGTQLAVYASGIFSFTSQHIIGVIVPLLVLTLDSSPLVVGIVLASRHFLPIIMSIPGGVLMDRLGPRKVMLYAASLCVITPYFYPITPWALALIILQLISGYITNVGWVGSQTLIGQMSRGSTKYAGWFTFSLRGGILAGPALGGLCWDLWGPWGGFAILSLWGLGFLVATLAMPDRPGSDGPDAAPLKLADLKPKLSDYTGALGLMVMPAVAFVIVISTLRIAGQAIEGSFYAVYLSDIGYSGTEIGLLFTTSAAVGFAGSLAVEPLTRLLKGHWLLVLTSSIATVGIALTPLLNFYPLLMVAMAVRGFTLGVSQPLLISLNAQNVDRELQGTVVGLRNTLNRVAQFTLPMIMGAIGEVVGIANSFLVVGATLVIMMGVSTVNAWRKGAFVGK